jgi:hypothetical protein
MLSLSIMLVWPGIDVSDQMTDHYSAELGTVIRWRKVLLHLFDGTVTNAYIQLFQLRLSSEQSGKVEYERERLLGIANKLMYLLAIPSSLSRSYSTFPLCSGDNLN